MRALTVKQIQPLVEKHIERYSQRLELAKRGVPTYTMESKKYLDLWLGIKAKGCNWTKMTKAEQWEAEEAYDDENG